MALTNGSTVDTNWTAGTNESTTAHGTVFIETSTFLEKITTSTHSILDSTTIINTRAHDDQNMKTINAVHYFCSVFGTIFICLGLCGNVLSILVWKRKNMRCSTGTYLIGQAIADIGLLVFFFLTENVPALAPSVTTTHDYGVFYIYLGYPMFYYFLVCSIWITMGVTIDRYIQVCWITKAKKLCNEKRAVIGLVAIAVLSFIINIPHFNTHEPVPDNEITDAKPAYRKSPFGKSRGSDHYEFWVHCVFLVLGPWVGILILNALILRQVANMRKQMAKRSSVYGRDKAKKSEALLTRILLMVSFTFLIFIFPECIAKCFFMLHAGHPDTVSKALSIAKTGVVVNKSINFWLYCLSGRKFRKELRIVVCSGFCADNERDSSMLLSSGSSTTLTRSQNTMPSKSTLTRSHITIPSTSTLTRSQNTMPSKSTISTLSDHQLTSVSIV